MIRMLLTIAVLALSFPSKASDGAFYLCNWCETRADFIDVAEINGKSLPVNQEAEYSVIVANDLDGVIYSGSLLVEN